MNRARGSILAFGLALVGGCLGPSGRRQAAQVELTRKLTAMEAVYLPPDDRRSCLEGTMRRLAEEETVFAAEERWSEAGLEACQARFERSRLDAGLGPEAGVVWILFGVGPDGAACAVLEPERPDPLDPRAASLVAEAARCVKDVVYAMRFARPTKKTSGAEPRWGLGSIRLDLALGPTEARRSRIR